MELLLRSYQEKKPYRLKCRFGIGAHPSEDRLQQEALRSLDSFVVDMHHQGWDYVPGYEQFSGPYMPIAPMTLYKQPELTAKQMMPLVAAGRKLHQGYATRPLTVLRPQVLERWEYEIRAVFIRRAIHVEVA